MAVGDIFPVTMKSEFDAKVNFADIDTQTGTAIQSTVADDFNVELTKIEGATQVTKATLAFTATTITTTGADFSGFSVGDTITITGCATAANNTTGIITAVAAKVLTCGASAFTAVTETGDVSITNGTVTYSTAISPSNPATITNVSNFDVVACGKNLFDFATYSLVGGGATYVKTSDGYTVSNTTSMAYAFSSVTLTLKPSTVYMIKINSVTVTSGAATVSVRDKSGNLIVNANSANSYTVAFASPTNGIAEFRFFSSLDTAVIGNVTYGKIQLETGSTATTYEAYKSNKLTVTSELKKIPSTGTCDVRQKDSDGVYREYIKIGKYTFTGTETFSSTYYSTHKFFQFTLTSASSGTSVTNLLCNMFTVNSNHNYGNTISKHSGYPVIDISPATNVAATVAELQAFLAAKYAAGTPVVLYYELATPVTTVLSDQTLTSYKSITNIYTTSSPQVSITGLFKSRLRNSVDVLRGMPATNLVSNGDFSNGTVGWIASGTSISAVNNVLTMLSSSSSGAGFVYAVFPVISGHKYYIKAKIKADSTLVKLKFSDNIGVVYEATHSGSNLYEEISFIITATSTTSSAWLMLKDIRTNSWTNCYMSNALALDLTQIFADGVSSTSNEPSVTEMNTLMAKFTNSYFNGTVNPLLTHKELMNYLNKNKADVKQEDWITPTLLNGWTEVSGYPVRYMKDTLGSVHLKGRVQVGTANTSCFTLPTGYKPLAIASFACAHNPATSFVRVLIGSGGSVIPESTYTSYVDLANITFRAEQ